MHEKITKTVKIWKDGYRYATRLLCAFVRFYQPIFTAVIIRRKLHITERRLRFGKLK